MTKKHSTATVATSLLLSHSLAHAEAWTASSVIPELKLAASTAREAEAMLSGNIYLGGAAIDVQLQPLVKIKTNNGIGQILETSEVSSNSPP